MAQADDVRASVKVCMFDQYGTVVDMQTGLTEVAAPFLAAKGWQGMAAARLVDRVARGEKPLWVIPGLRGRARHASCQAKRP